MRVNRRRAELGTKAQGTAGFGLDETLRLLSTPRGTSAAQQVRDEIDRWRRDPRPAQDKPPPALPLAVHRTLDALHVRLKGGELLGVEVKAVQEEAAELRQVLAEYTTECEAAAKQLADDLGLRLAMPRVGVTTNLDQILQLCEARIAEIEGQGE